MILTNELDYCKAIPSFNYFSILKYRVECVYIAYIFRDKTPHANLDQNIHLIPRNPQFGGDVAVWEVNMGNVTIIRFMVRFNIKKHPWSLRIPMLDIGRLNKNPSFMMGILMPKKTVFISKRVSVL